MMEVSHSMEEPDGSSIVKRLSVPIGLEELMTSLTKEVLKKKPMDIYNFASDHFTQLLSLREDGNYSEPTAKILTYISNVDFKNANRNEKQSKEKQLARQVSLNVQPFIQDFKIVGKKSELKSDKRNKKEELVKQRNEKLKLNKKKSLSKVDQEKNLNLQNDNKNKSKESNGEVNKKSQKILPSKGKSTKIKKRVKSVDNFTSFSNFSKNHNIIDPEDIQICSLDKDNVSLSSENINAKNYDPLSLRKELIKVQDESKFTSFTTTYNPYKLRQEIKSISLDETTTKNNELEREFLKDDVGASNNETVNIKVENVEEKDCSINESDKAKDVILDKNSNFHEGSVIEKKEIQNLEANETISTVDAANEHNHDKDIIEENVKEVLSEEDNLNKPTKTSNEEKAYNASKIFASAGLAAVKIQSMWRGFKTRKSIPVINNKNSNLKNKEETSSTFSGLNNEMILYAATKIQAGVRGYLSRKQNKKVVDAINDEKQNDESKNKDELKEETQNVICNNKNELRDNLIESNENTQEASLITANLNSNVNDNKCINKDESIHSEIKDAAANNKELTEIKIINKETTDVLDQSTEPSSLQEVTESNIQTVIENEINATPSIDIKNTESEVKEENSKLVENLPKFEETTINENIIDEVVPTELNNTSQNIENIEKNLIIEEKLNSKDLELKSITTELDEINLPSTISEPNLKAENNDNVNEAKDEKKLESLTTENDLKEDDVKNSADDENKSVDSDPNLIENINKEIILDIKNASDINNTGSPELAATINDENFVNENENTKQGVREKRSLNFQEIIEEENNKLIDSLNNSKNIAINNDPKMSEINEEIETSANEQLHVVMQPEVMDVIEHDNNEAFQKDSKTEQESIESNLLLGSILQHSGELHDTPTYFNDECKLSSDSIIENVEKEDNKSLLNLEHSGELHDLVIVETSNNSKSETVQFEESKIKSIKHNLQEEEEDRLSGKDRKKSKNIIEDSKVENFEENYEIITNDTSGLYDIEELIESEDKISVNLEDGNVMSQLTEINIDRNEIDKEAESEEKEKHSLNEKAESKVLLQPNEENIKSDDIEILTELHEMEKSKVPEDDLIQSENKILQLIELSDASVHGVDPQVIKEHIENDNLQSFDKGTEETEKIINVDDGTLVINESAALELSTTDNKVKVDESVEQLTDNKIAVANSENMKNSEIKNDISEITEKEEVKSETKKFDLTQLRAELNEANIVSKEDTDLVTSSENKESSEIDKIEEKVIDEGIEDKSKLKIFDTTKLRAELEEAENISTNGADIDTSTNGKESVEKDITVIEENIKLEKEITKIEVTKLSAGLDIEEKIIKDISIDESTVDNGKSEEDIIGIEKNGITNENVEIKNSENNIAEEKEQVSIEGNLEAENTVNKFDITKLRAELEETDNLGTKSPNLDIPTNGKATVQEITNGKEENAKIEKDIEVEKGIKKVDVTKLSAGLAAVEKVIENIKIDSSTEDTESSEINIAEKEENSEIERNVEISSKTKQFDITKLRAELEEAENINTESTNLDADIVEEIKNNKVENGEIKEGTTVVEKIEKSEVTKLSAELAVTEEITKTTIIDESTENTECSEKIVTAEEDVGKIEENLKAENAAKTFDPTKLRAELDKAENISTESTNQNTSIEEIKDDKNKNAETVKSIEVEKEIKKSEVTKLEGGLAVPEKMIKDTIIDKSTESTGSSEKNITNSEEISKIKENVETENPAITFDITKLRTELEETENINLKSIDLDTSQNEKNVGETKDDAKENTETEESTGVETEIEKTEVIKLDAGLDITENITKDTIIDESTEETESFETIIIAEEEVGKIKENVEAENAAKKFDITKLRDELKEVENINTKSTDHDISINETDIVGETKGDAKENAETKESTEIKKEIEKTELTTLDTGLAVAEDIIKDTIIDKSTEDTGSSEKIFTAEDEVDKIKENVEAENAAKKFDLTKLRAELDEAENINTKSTDHDTSINETDIVGEIKSDAKENAETKESTEIEKEIEKTDITTLDAGLAVAEDITKDTIIDKSTEDTGSSEKIITAEDEVGKIEENVEAEITAKAFDLTKLRAELDEAENINTESINQDTSINSKDIVEEIKDVKNENAETVESIEVKNEIEKSEVTKLDSGLAATEKITKDTIIDKSTDDAESSEKNTTKEKDISKIEENIEAKKFDITKLRAELDEVKNINAKNGKLDTTINEKIVVEQIKDDNEKTAEIENSTEVEKEIEKTEVTKTEEIIKDTNIDNSTKNIGSSEKNMIDKEENIKVSSEAKQFDITKLRAELDEAENINTKTVNLDSPTNKKNIVKDIKNGKEQNAETAKSAEVEKETEKTEATKLDTGLNVTEEIMINTNINASTESTRSFEENIIEKEEDNKNKEGIEVPSETKQFDITKLRAELDEAENINTKVTNLDTFAKEKDIVEEVKNGKEKNIETEKSAEVENEMKKTKVTKLGTGLAYSSIDVSSEGYGSFEKEEKAKIEENIEVPCETNKFDLTKLRTELYDTENINTDETDSHTPTDGKEGVEENIHIKENVKIESKAQNFDISKLRTELDHVQLLNTEDKNVFTSAVVKDSLEEIKNSDLEFNNEDIKEETSTVSKLNEKDSNKSVEKVEENITTNKFDLSKLQAELYDTEDPKEDHNLIENMDKTEEITAVENTIVTNTKIEENGKANKFDLSKLRAELSVVGGDVKPTDEKELDNNDKSELEKQNIENKSHNEEEVNNTSQLHLIDNENNNDAIKSNTTNDVDHQLTVINNDIQDVNKNIKNENTLQLEPLHTTHSISGKEFEFIPTESSDNLIISPNDSNQSFSNKEVEPKINKEVMTNTNQESNFNQTLLNNEANSINRQDDMIDERAQSGISASPDSEVTVIFNTNSLNKLDDNLVNISGNSTPTDKTELETEESAVNDTGENLENKNSDISKLRMEIENSSKVIQEQTEDLTNESNSDLKSTDDKTKGTLNTAATLIQSVYRGYQVRNKLKDQVKKSEESKKDAPYSTDKFNLIQPKNEQELNNEDFGISDALGNLLNQQIAIAAPNAIEVDKSGNQPEYIHIPLKDSIDKSNLDQNRSVSQLQHSGEFHDVFPISNLSSDVSKSDKLDEIVTSEVNEKPVATNNSIDNDKKFNIENEENILKVHQAADGSVPQALEVVLNQQLAITTPCAKFEEKDKSNETDKVDYIHIPLKDLNVATDSTDVNLESQHEVDVSANNQTNNGLNKSEITESANINNEAITDNRSVADEEKINKFVNNKNEESANNNVLVNYSFEPDGSIQDENMPMVVQNTQTSGSTMPVEVQPNQAPGAEILTSPTSVDETEASLIIENAEEIAQTSEKDASSKDEPTKNGAHLQTSMETSNRENTTLTEQNMENVAATKIQASFRGYQVRKQLKPKILKIGKSIVQLILLQHHNGGVDSITLRRSLRRKSSGKLRGSENSSKKQMDKSSDLEEKSATKIQAGIRGFLVRRRQTKAKNISQKSS